MEWLVGDLCHLHLYIEPNKSNLRMRLIQFVIHNFLLYYYSCFGFGVGTNTMDY
jgi:hypothetical protein